MKDSLTEENEHEIVLKDLEYRAMQEAYARLNVISNEIAKYVDHTYTAS